MPFTRFFRLHTRSATSSATDMARFGEVRLGEAVRRIVRRLRDKLTLYKPEAVIGGSHGRGTSSVGREPTHLSPTAGPGYTRPLQPSTSHLATILSAETATTTAANLRSTPEAPLTRRHSLEDAPRVPSRSPSEEDNVGSTSVGCPSAPSTQPAALAELYDYRRYLYALTLVGPADESCLARLAPARAGSSSCTPGSTSSQANHRASSCSSPASALPTDRFLALGNVAAAKSEAAQQAYPVSSLQGDWQSQVLANQAELERSLNRGQHYPGQYYQATAGVDDEADFPSALVDTREVTFAPQHSRLSHRQYVFYHGAEALHV